MRPFFPQELLERVRVTDLSETGEGLPYPPFYSRVKAGGARVVPEAAHLTSIPFIDLIAFGTKADRSNSVSRAGAGHPVYDPGGGAIHGAVCSRAEQKGIVYLDFTGEAGL